MSGSTRQTVLRDLVRRKPRAGDRCVVDGCPPGLELSAADIQNDLDRRKPGTSRHVTQRREDDVVEILSGVFEGKTTGTPIALLIRNVDARSKDYSKIQDTFRPGHADYTYWQKYGIRDYRGGGRASARETAVRVAAAAIARKWLREKYGITVRGYLSQLGPLEVSFKSWDAVNANPFFVADAAAVPQLEEFMDKLRKSGDSCGARITTIASGVPAGWGEPVYDKLDADIANMMSINAVKGVEIGAFCRGRAERHRALGRNVAAGLSVQQRGGILGGYRAGRTSSSTSRSSRLRASGCPPHDRQAGTRPPLKRMAATTRASASARRRFAR